MQHLRGRCLRSLLLAVLLTTVLFGQADRGTITGTVKDASGAVIPGSSVTIRSEGTGQAIELTANEAGVYVSGPLRPGVYTVEARNPGFQPSAKRFTLEITQRAVVDFELQVGQVTEVVEVQDVAPILQTETATLSGLRTERAVKDLPLNGRNFAQLIQLSAGVTPAQTQQGGSPITMKRGVTGNSVNGARLEENNFLVDGVSNAENHNGLGILIFPSIDAIEEFRVESSVSDVQFGRGGGGTINVVYKSGTQEFHGTLYEFLRNDELDAKNFFDAADEPIPKFRQNQFGGTIGGPLFPQQSQKSTFFFFSYEGLRVRQGQTFVSTLPTPEFRQGDFSASDQRIFDPLTQRRLDDGAIVRDPFPNNTIPTERIDPVGRNILDLFPQPNRPGAGVANNFLSNPVRSIDGDKFDIKIDHVISSTDTIFGRWSYSDDDLVEPSFLPAPAVGAGPGVPGPADQPVNQVVIGETHMFSPTVTNEARAGWTRLNLRSFNPNFGRNVSEEIGVPGANVPGDELTSGLSIFGISGFRNLGGNGFSPAIIVSDNFQFNDNLQIVRGRHTFKFGGEYQRRRYNAFQSSVLRGNMSFSTGFSQNPANAQGTGLGAADVLLGKPSSGVIRFLNGTRGFRRNEFSLWAQDTWKATDKLTVVLGLRYEVYDGWPWTEVNNRQYNLNFETGELFRVPTGSGLEGDFNNLGPRIGIAYRVTPKTVFRAGYGIYYSAPQWDVTRNLAANPPEFIVSSFNNDEQDFQGARPASQGFDRPAAGTIEGGTLRALDPTSRIPMTQQWNASLQRELPNNISFTAAYVGTKGTALQGFPDINQAVPGDGPVNLRRAYPQFDTISGLQTRFNSIYHGLQLQAERRFSEDLGLIAAYTWSHVIDDVGAQFGNVLNFRDISMDRGSAGFDLRNRLSVSASYSLPFEARSRTLDQIIGGWRVNAIVSIFDGIPFTVGSAVNTLNIASGNRANRIGDGNLPGDQETLDRFFDTSAFAAPGFRQFGNSGRNILVGPNTRQVDFSLFKDFDLTADGEKRLQFRAEFFNLFNRPQFNNPNSTFGTPGFGSISSAGSPLTLQRISRQIQFALKLLF